MVRKSEAKGCARDGSVLSRLQAAAEAGGEALDLRPLVRGAACLGDEDTLRLLLDAGGGALLKLSDDDDDFGSGCLGIAVEEEHHGVLKQLLRAGADPNACPPETHPLSYAAEKGSVAMVESLLLAGANANGGEGARPLYFAAAEGHIAVIEQLLEAGADADQISEEHEETSLNIAVENGHAGAVEALLNAGADVDKEAYDTFYPTPLLTAIYELSHDEDINEDAVLILKLLLDAGADANKKHWVGWTPLSRAARFDHVDVCEMLLAAGADVELSGGKALKNAVDRGNRSVALLLTRRKASKEELTRPQIDTLAEWLAEDIEARDKEMQRIVSGIPVWCAEAASCTMAAARGRGSRTKNRKRKHGGR